MFVSPALALLLLGLSPQAIQLSVNVNEGEVITAEREFRVSVQTTQTVTQVEFYYNDSLRDKDTSVPYEFKIDPLNEQDGDAKLSFIAYTTEGQNARKDVRVVIDSGVAKGADYHVEQAEQFLVDGKWDQAIRSGRTALKAKPGYNPARLVLARAYMGQGVFDEAQRLAEDAVKDDPNFTAARELLSAINLQRAFSTFHRGGERRETLDLIRSALTDAVQARVSVLNAQFDRLGPATDENRLQFADTAFRAGRYSAAITALQQPFQRNPSTELGNRLVFAQIRSARFNDAVQTLGLMQRQNVMDAYSYALLAIVNDKAGDTSAADNALKEAVADQYDHPGVRTAQIYIALRRGNRNAMTQLAQQLAADEGHRPEVNYYLSIAYNVLGRYEDATRRFEQAVLAEPAHYDMYVERGNQALNLVAGGRITDGENRRYHFDVASIFYQAALEAKPDSPEALTGITLSHGLQGRIPDMARMAQAAERAAPGYAPALYVASLAYSRMRDELNTRAEQTRRAGDRAEAQKLQDQATQFGQDARRVMQAAERLDPRNLQGRAVPTIDDVYRYFYQHGRIPVLTPPSVGAPD
jgi:tetratricopeptide (TPR) repeat protein